MSLAKMEAIKVPKNVTHFLKKPIDRQLLNKKALIVSFFEKRVD